MYEGAAESKNSSQEERPPSPTTSADTRPPKCTEANHTPSSSSPRAHFRIEEEPPNRGERAKDPSVVSSSGSVPSRYEPLALSAALDRSTKVTLATTRHAPVERTRAGVAAAAVAADRKAAHQRCNASDLAGVVAAARRDSVDSTQAKSMCERRTTELAMENALSSHRSGGGSPERRDGSDDGFDVNTATRGLSRSLGSAVRKHLSSSAAGTRTPSDASGSSTVTLSASLPAAKKSFTTKAVSAAEAAPPAVTETIEFMFSRQVEKRYIPISGNGTSSTSGGKAFAMPTKVVAPTPGVADSSDESEGISRNNSTGTNSKSTDEPAGESGQKAGGVGETPEEGVKRRSDLPTCTLEDRDKTSDRGDPGSLGTNGKSMNEKGAGIEVILFRDGNDGVKDHARRKDDATVTAEPREVAAVPAAEKFSWFWTTEGDEKNNGSRGKKTVRTPQTIRPLGGGGDSAGVKGTAGAAVPTMESDKSKKSGAPAPRRSFFAHASTLTATAPGASKAVIGHTPPVVRPDRNITGKERETGTRTPGGARLLSMQSFRDMNCDVASAPSPAESRQLSNVVEELEESIRADAADTADLPHATDATASLRRSTTKATCPLSRPAAGFGPAQGHRPARLNLRPSELPSPASGDGKAAPVSPNRALAPNHEQLQQHQHQHQHQRVMASTTTPKNMQKTIAMAKRPQQQHLPSPIRAAGTGESVPSPHANDLSTSAPHPLPAAATYRSPGRRAYLSPGPATAQKGGTSRRSSMDSPGPRKNEVLPAPSPDGTTPRSGGFGGTVGRRGVAALRAAATSDRSRGQVHPPSSSERRAEKETSAGRSLPMGKTPSSDGSYHVGSRNDCDAGVGRECSGSSKVGHGGESDSVEVADPTKGDGGLGGRVDSGRTSHVCDLAPLARELPGFLARAVGLSGCLRALASCQAVSREWRDALGGDGGKELFTTIVRSSGVPASLRPTVWQTLVLRAVGHGTKHRRGSSSSAGSSRIFNSGGGGGSCGSAGGRDSLSSTAGAPVGVFAGLVEKGKASPHAALISRDVPRAFGAVAPHKRQDNGNASVTATEVKRGLATTTPPWRGNRRRITVGGAAVDEGDDDDEDEEGFFDGAVGGALVHLLGGKWKREDDGEGGDGPGERFQAAAGSPQPRRRGSGATPKNQRRASVSSTSSRGGGVGGGGFNDVGGGSGPFSWLSRDVSPDGRGSSARTSMSPKGEPGRFTLASLPLSPFGNLNDYSTNSKNNNGNRNLTASRTFSSTCPSPLGGGDGDGGGVRRRSRSRLDGQTGRGRGASPGREGSSPTIHSRKSTVGRARGQEVLTFRRQQEEEATIPPAAAAAEEEEVEATEVVEEADLQALEAAEETRAETEAPGAGATGGLIDEEAWLVKSEEAWAMVPVESKRECLGNVLFAIAARFPDVGYCQGMDRLLSMLMMFYFVSPEDTTTAGIMTAAAETTSTPLSLPSSSLLSPAGGGEATGGEGGGGGGGGENRRKSGCYGRLSLDTNVVADRSVTGAPSPGSETAATPRTAGRAVPATAFAATAPAALRRSGGGDDGVDAAGEGNSGNSPPQAPTISKTASAASATISVTPPFLRTPPPPTPPPEPPKLGERVFNVFSGLIEGFRLHDLYVPERGGVLVCTEVLTHLAAYRLPELASHFHEIDFSIDMVAMGWFQTLFVYLHAMPRATVRRIWDWWLSSGDFEVFFRVSMAILKLSQEHLLPLDFDGTVKYFNSFPEPSVLSPDVLLPSAAEVAVEEGELMYLELQVRQREKLEVPSVTQLMLRPML